jgi:hypothetical protein
VYYNKNIRYNNKNMVVFQIQTTTKVQGREHRLHRGDTRGTLHEQNMFAPMAT